MSSNIPEEIFSIIFLKLPVQSLLACKYVCKTWFSVISSPDFVKMQLNLAIQRNKPILMLKGYDRSGSWSRNVFYSIDHDSLELLLSKDRFLEYAVEIDYPFKSLGYSVELMDTCDGLVCLWFYYKRCFCLWNPATREYKVLPKSNNVYTVYMVAFGYDYKSNDYKLLVGFHGGLFQVCSLGSNSWKTIENVPYEFYSREEPSGVLVDGEHHWLSKRKDCGDDVLISLDISNQIFKEVALPEEALKSKRVFRNLGVLEGYLCLFTVNYYFCTGCVELWIMQNYGVRESWTRHYITMNKTILNSYMSLMWSFKGGEILLLGGAAGLYLYYIDHDVLPKPNIDSTSTYLYKGGCYSESLVSLKSGTYIGREEPIE